MAESIFNKGFYYYFHKDLDPHFNEALEEVLLSASLDKALVMIWRNDLSVVLGRFQHPLKEVNLKYAKEKDIKIIRRVSGGGCVYHDLGNINYGIYADTDSRNIDYLSFLKPVQKLAGKLGYKLDINEDIDLYFEGKKVSGSAQRNLKNRILHHGTMLFNPIKDNMSCIFKHLNGGFEFKGTESRRAQVGCLIEAKQDPDINSLLQRLEDLLIMEKGQAWRPNQDILNRARDLAESKYKDPDWTYGKSPKLKIFKEVNKFNVSLKLVKGRLESIEADENIYKIYPDLDEFIGKYLEEDYFKNGQNSLIGRFFDFQC